jgi:hypothetical protein
MPRPSAFGDGQQEEDERRLRVFEVYVGRPALDDEVRHAVKYAGVPQRPYAAGEQAGQRRHAQRQGKEEKAGCREKCAIRHAVEPFFLCHRAYPL